MGARQITDRFRGVENSPAATAEQAEVVSKIRQKVLELALLVDAVPQPRYKATALTHLETAAMFAVKGVFAPQDV